MAMSNGVFGTQGVSGAPQQNLVDQRLSQTQSFGALPSGLLLTHATEYFNLGNNPRWAIIPDSVKWQLLHAASAFKDGSGSIHLSSGELGIDHLNMQELAILYRIIRSYHFSREKNIYGEHAMFHKHVELIEARFEKVCSENQELGREALRALRSFDDESLAPIAMKLDGILNGTLQPAIQLSLIDSKIGMALQIITQEMAQNITKATYPSGLLLLFAQEHYNLRNNPLSPMRIPEEVKWQLLHAATANKHEKTKVVSLGENFGYEHLSQEHLVCLLMILTAYHAFEKTAKGEGAIFSKHLFLIEGVFEQLCWNRPSDGLLAIAALKGTYNPILNPIIEKLEKIFTMKDRYLAIANTFENNIMLMGVFSAKSPKELKAILEANGPKAVMAQVKTNYDAFIRWMKTVSDMEALEKDPTVQKAVRRWKSEIQESFFTKHYNMICQICDAYPELFKDTFARWNSLAVLNNGAKIILDKFRAKGSISAEPVICSSYQDYREKLRAVANSPVPNGEWYFSIRCESTSPYEFGVHQTGAYVEKINGQVFVQILDASSYDFDNGPYKVAGLTREASPTAVLGSTMSVRQRDYSNCAFFMFTDMKAISRNKQNIQWLRDKSVNILDYVRGKAGEDAVAFWHTKASQAHKDVRVTPDVPLDFMAPTQSLSQVAKAIKTGGSPATTQSIAKLEERVRRHKLIELATDNAVTGSDVSGYTKLKAMKYRLYIVEHTFVA